MWSYALKKLSLSSLLALFRIQSENTELVRAQFAAFSKQIPLLYFILTVDTLSASFTFTRFAPAWLSIYLPSALCAFCFIRCMWWWKSRKVVYSDAQIIKYTRVTTRLCAFLTFSFTIWALMLYPYGDAYAQGQIVFTTCLSVIGCTFCLMHLRPAALSVTLFANTPFILYFLLFEPHLSMKVVAVNLALVSIAMVAILLVYSGDFERLVASKAESRRLGDENFRLANLDALTGLANRRWFFSELGRQYELAAKNRRGFAVGIIDLDGFKPVNDTYGHSTGDRVLFEAGHRLQKACGDGAVLARLGGDEFGFILSGDPGDAHILALGQTISDAIRQPFAVGGSYAALGSSIGVAQFPQTAQTPEALFERADYALYHAKRHARGQMVLFSTGHEAQIRSHSGIEQALQTADLESELFLAFQPITDITSARTVAFEALARWNSPELGLVNPSSFIPVAERAGLIGAVTKILLKKALAEAASWPENLRISFNLSAHDLCVSECVVQIIALIRKSGIDTKRLDFEITETSVATDFNKARDAIQIFKSMGVGISLDDFGTGYSSLSHVHSLPLDKIKVDQSFVTDITENPASLKIVKSLTALCSDMGLACIIEGVETEAQLATLRELGCTLIQGYYFARPLSAADVRTYLETENERQSAQKSEQKSA